MTVGLAPKNTQPSGELATAEGTCIASWQDLLYMSQNEPERVQLFPNTLKVLPPLLLIHIHMDATNGSDLYNSSSYCPLSGDQCAVLAVYSQSIFAVYPVALLVSFGLAIGYTSAVQHWQYLSMAEITWTLQKPLCSVYYLGRIVKDFAHYVVSKMHTL